MYKYLKAFFASFPSVQSTPSCPLSWIVTSVANDLILIEPDREKYFLLTQLIFCKRSVPKPNKVAHLRSPSEPSYYIPQRDGTPQQSSHDCVLDCVGTEKLKYYTEHLEWESKVEGTMVLLSVSVQFSSVQSCPNVWDSMDCSMPGFPVHDQLPEPTQIHVHCIGDTIQPSVIPFSSHLQSFSASGSFQVSQVAKVLGVSASASVLPMNIQDWFPLGWTGLISLLSKGLSRVQRVQKHQFFSAQLSL